MKTVFFSNSENETHKIAARFAKTLRGGEVILLEGELGAGKTAFTRGLAGAFGVSEPIRSPTFTLMHVHKIKKRARGSNIKFLIHADAYRLSGAKALRQIGLEEYLGRDGAAVIVEWGGKARSLFREFNTITVTFDFGKKINQRKLVIQQRKKPRPRS